MEEDFLFALVQSYVTKAPKHFESHRRYIDIQFLFEGEEIIQHGPIGQLTISTSYNEEKDFQLYHLIPHSTSLLLAAGDFVIFHPEDGHAPGCAVTTPGPARKVVMKVAV